MRRVARATAQQPRSEQLTALLPIHHQEVLSTLAAERERKQGLSGRLDRGAALIAGRQVAPVRSIKGHIGGVPLTDELMELECEQRTTIGTACPRPSQQCVSQRLLTHRVV